MLQTQSYSSVPNTGAPGPSNADEATRPINQIGRQQEPQVAQYQTSGSTGSADALSDNPRSTFSRTRRRIPDRGKRGSENDIQPDIVEMHVSAMHLIEASKHFETVLADEFQRPRQPGPQNVQTIHLWGINAPALRILMMIAHARYNQLPTYIDFQMLFEVCLQIDKYDMHELTALQVNIWFEHLMDQIPSHPTRDIDQWIFVCYVLQKPKQFEELTEMVLKHYFDAAGGFEHPLLTHFRGK